jgi:hypothetical protein
LLKSLSIGRVYQAIEKAFHRLFNIGRNSAKSCVFQPAAGQWSRARKKIARPPTKKAHKEPPVRKFVEGMD